MRKNCYTARNKIIIEKRIFFLTIINNLTCKDKKIIEKIIINGIIYV